MVENTDSDLFADRRWETEVVFGADNEHALLPLFDAKGNFEVRGIALPVEFILCGLLSPHGAPAGTVQKIVVTLSSVRNEATGVLQVLSSVEVTKVQPGEEGGAAQPMVIFQSETNFGPAQETVEGIVDHLKTLQQPEARQIESGDVPPDSTPNLPQ
jgi:hypothetical protein